MPKKKSSIDVGEPTPLRRSNRILLANSAKVQKPKSSRIQVCISPISSYSLRTHLKSPITATIITSCAKKSIESVGKSANRSNGSIKSTKQTNRAEKSQGCRRSPRFSTLERTPEISEEKSSLSNGGKRSVLKTDGVNCVQACRRPSIVVLGLRAVDGSKVSTRKIDGVGEFRDCRRSPRLLIARNTQILEKKNCAKSNSGFEESLVVSANTPETFEMKKCVKSSNGANESTRQIIGVEGFQDWFQVKEKIHEESDSEAYVNRECGDLAECLEKEVPLQVLGKRKLVKCGTPSLEVLGAREIQTQKKGKEKKKSKRNVNCGSKENSDDNDYQQPKVHGSLGEVQKGTLTHLRTPFGSLENICSEKGKIVCHEINSKELVESKGVLCKSVKSTWVSGKNSVKSISNQCGVQEWSKEQELALQRAYLTAKPSPHFWKKISKLVPGKTAQDCFDKIQSDSITTPQPQPRYRSRANKTNPSPLSHFSLSGSKLLESAKPTVKKSRGNKRTKCQAHKTARHLLQKQQNIATQGFQRDLFSILEPTTTMSCSLNQEAKSLATPVCKVQSFLQRSSSSSNKKKSFSRFRNSSLTPLVSPPVLKRVKNMAIHEKYIDQLHNREAKRMAGGKKCVGDDKKGKVQKVDVIKAAKNALVCDARDMIKTFQHMQANAIDISDEDFDTDDMSEGDNEEE